jgi:cell wall-associated NlpC family hydrolase
MSTVPRAERVKNADNLRPGDLMFWGYKGPRSKPADNFHTGLWLGNGWFIHSSGSNAGPTISRLDGWWLEHFSWGRHLNG